MNSKYYPIIKFCRHAALMKRRLTLPVKLVKSGFWKSESYYPEMPNHKSKLRILCELMWHIMEYGTIEYHYFSYGFDIKGLRDKNDYLDDNWFLWKASMFNTVLPKWDYTCVLRDKALFSELLLKWGYNTPQIVYDSEINNFQIFENQLFVNGGGIFANQLTVNVEVAFSKL